MDNLLTIRKDLSDASIAMCIKMNRDCFSCPYCIDKKYCGISKALNDIDTIIQNNLTTNKE